jgi:protein-serine/threonine kinase
MEITPRKNLGSSNGNAVLALSPVTHARAASMISESGGEHLLFGTRSPDGTNTAVVLYDTEQQALVARRVRTPEPGDDQHIMHSPDRNRCPLCNSELTSDITAPFVSESYFPTLAYFHRRLGNLPSGEDANNIFTARPPSHSSPTAAARDLHNISASLLVNGYYSRFFEEIKLLGTGSFGSVFLCRHVIDSVNLGEFAVKKVPVGDSREWLRNMMREVKALERLASHPNIVSYKHSWLEMHRANELCPFVPYLFILMSFCDHGSLEDLVHRPDNHLSDDIIWSLFLDICQGLQHLHRNYVVHRDLKLSNILLTGNPIRAVLSDFGTAEIVTGRTSSPFTTGFTGTAEFTAPEVFESHSYSESADLWSLGVVLFAMCYGRVPVSHPDPAVCAQRIVESSHVEIPATPIRDPNLVSLITALTSRDPFKRPSCDDILFHPFIRQKLEDRS